ncbi:protein translocase subunit SecD [Desulfurivibrio alkaliphilus]|uniref:Multifunctional fusion protein n=1 Tax=Desulfurivibrio alkaliphilus (strain DSM 19089 / UNIQEM U267 / AHT2) TaxID=589865 RepID=D6Z188_DESAT|nr:protein translocase subunit SecD [Desulfurivibrio alkaliphilus]ADH85343.1 protein-export membrane protein SecD [Desulfurivibrio alkaliphilus AHT 2]
MPSSLKWKIGLLFFMIVFAVVTVLPSLSVPVPGWWKKNLAPEGLRLGLDLQGGMHLVLKVDIDQAIANSLDLAAEELRATMRDERITLVRARHDDPHIAVFTLPNVEALNTVERAVANDFPNLKIRVESEEGTFPRVFLSLDDEQVEFIEQNAVRQSLEIIRNRIDQFGVAEPVIVRQGLDEIVVQLPGVRDPDRAIDLIGQTAQLEFKLVDDSGVVDLDRLINQAIEAGQWERGGDRQQLNQALRGQLPEEREIYFHRRVDRETGQERQEPILLHVTSLMTGEMVRDARVRVGGTFNEPYVSLDLTARGGRLFGQITERNVGRQLAIVLDDVVRSAPVIRERILGGSAQISGGFTHGEASDLAIVLRVGALPAPVDIIQNLTVGASLGQDSIQRGIIAGLFGALLVATFMVIYYRLSGVIANAALLLNVLFIFTGLAMMQATLTLPGIAGIILAIGMAVDANVLIFERMREEFALGKTVKSGVEGGYSKAFSTIIDSQVTTLITALALFLFGTGPIQGFAVTLSLGVTFNLITTLFGTKIVYDFLHSKRKLKEIRFLTLLTNPGLDFMRLRRYAFGISGIMLLVGAVAMVEVYRGTANLGVDFSGGTMAQYQAQQPFDLAEVRQALSDAGLEGAQPQHVEGENRLIVRIKEDREVVGQITNTITAALDQYLGDKGFWLESQSEIGSAISETLRNKALQAILIALLGVLIYLALRFQMRFGLAAAGATFHDVIVVLGICWLFNIEITLLIVTALLTIAGYSLNDSVVVFDRIRENIKKRPGDDLKVLINRSVNEIISRTVITSLTTALVLVSLLIYGGVVLHDFSLVLLIGILVGTFSSIFVASPLLMMLPGSQHEMAKSDEEKVVIEQV